MTKRKISANRGFAKAVQPEAVVHSTNSQLSFLFSSSAGQFNAILLL